MNVLEAFGLPGPRFVHLVGAGGKSTLMRALADVMAAAGHRVIVTTSTRIRESEASGELVLASDVRDLHAAVADALARHRRVTVAASRLPAEGKLAGLAPAVLESLFGAHLADLMLVEADGAAGRMLKAHGPHEPVIAPSADAVIAVVGAGILGQPADDAHVHRAVLMRERLGLPTDHVITPADVARIVLHPAGALASVPAGASVSVFVRHAAGEAAGAGAKVIAHALRAADASHRLARVVTGEL